MISDSVSVVRNSKDSNVTVFEVHIDRKSSGLDKRNQRIV